MKHKTIIVTNLTLLGSSCGTNLLNEFFFKYFLIIAYVARSCKRSDTWFKKSLLLFSTWREYFNSQPTHFSNPLDFMSDLNVVCGYYKLRQSTSQIMRARIFPKKSCVTFDVLHTNINVLFHCKFMYKYLKQ